jgi:hypothetical protein
LHPSAARMAMRAVYRPDEHSATAAPKTCHYTVLA